jgi:ribosome-binding protein aMBF1 (putative translation factor)
MSDPPFWVRTDEQIARVLAARRRGGICAACGRQLEAGEYVYFERFGVGAVRPRPLLPIRPRTHYHAPVGVECASPSLVAHASTQGVETCAGCGRGVVHPGARRTRKRPSCSQACGLRGWVAADPTQPTRSKRVQTKATERWGVRLKRLREARGMSRAELANACAGRGLRINARALNQYEDENYLPRVPTFAALARVLGVSMEALLYGEEEAARIAEERGSLGAAPG